MIRKQFGPDFKARVALEAVKGNKTALELCSEFGVQSTRDTDSSMEKAAACRIASDILKKAACQRK